MNIAGNLAAQRIVPAQARIVGQGCGGPIFDRSEGLMRVQHFSGHAQVWHKAYTAKAEALKYSPSLGLDPSAPPIPELKPRFKR